MASSTQKAKQESAGASCDWCGFEVSLPASDPGKECRRCKAPNLEISVFCGTCGASFGGISEKVEVGAGALLLLRIEGISFVASHSEERLPPALGRIEAALDDIAEAHEAYWAGRLGEYQIYFDAFVPRAPSEDDEEEEVANAKPKGDVDLPRAAGVGVRIALDIQARIDELLQELAMVGVVMAPLMGLYVGSEIMLRQGPSQSALPEAAERVEQLLSLGAHYEVVLDHSIVEALGAQIRTLPRAEGLGRHNATAFVLQGLGAPRLPSPLWFGEGSSVGRGDELDFLEDRWRGLASGDGPSMVTLIGASGFGKRRLVEDFLVELGLPEGRIEAIASAQVGPDPQVFGAMAQGLLRMIGVQGGEDTDDIRLRLGRAAAQACHNLDMRKASQEARRMTDLMSPYLGLRWSSSDTARLDAETLKVAAFSAFVRLLDGLTRHTPGLLVVEDLDQADSLTVEFLQTLGQATFIRGRLMVITTASPELPTRAPEWGIGFWRHDVLRLDKLQVEALIELGEGVSQRHGPLGEYVLEDLAEDSNGDPFFMEQVTLLAIEKARSASSAADIDNFNDDDMIFEEGDDLFFEEGAGDNEDGAALPSDISGVLLRRLAGLTAEQQELLGLFALMDQPGNIEVLEGVWRDDGRELEELHGGLHHLELHGFLRRRVGERSWRLRGRHLGPLAVARLSEAQRGSWSRRLAAYLQGSNTWDRFLAPYSRVGGHLQAGGLKDVALRFMALSSSRARRLGANKEAAAALSRAMELSLEERHKPALEESIAITLTRGSLRLALGDIPGALEDLHQGKDLAKALGDGKWRWNVQLVLAEALDAQGMLNRAGEVFEDITNNAPDPRQRIRALRKASALRFRTGDAASGEAMLTFALELAQDGGLDLRELAQILDELSIQRWLSGDAPKAIEGSDALLDYLQRTLPAGEASSV